MKKRWMAVCCVVLFAVFFIAAADTTVAAGTNAWKKGKTEVYTKGAFTYYIHPSKNKKEAWVYRIEMKKGKKGKSLSIPKTIRGKKVTRLGCPEFGKGDFDEAYATLFGTYTEPSYHWDGEGFNDAVQALKSIRIPDTVEVIDRAAFSGLDSVTTIKLPKKVKEIGMYTFYGCDKLKTVVLPEQLESFENNALWDCPSLKTIRLSKKNRAFEVRENCLIRKKDSTLVFGVAAGRKLTVPDGVKRISSCAFGSGRSPEIWLPASVEEIEAGAFNMYFTRQNIQIKDVTISEQNPVFARDGQCIYRRSDKSLAVAIPDKKGELRISEQVEKLTPEISLLNCDTYWGEYLKKVIFPSSLRYVEVPAFGAFTTISVYFTGSVLPELIEPQSAKVHKLPVDCYVYVPEAYDDVYKAWYKKHQCDTLLRGWNTYNPEAGF